MTFARGAGRILQAVYRVVRSASAPNGQFQIIAALVRVTRTEGPVDMSPIAPPAPDDSLRIREAILSD